MSNARSLRLLHSHAVDTPQRNKRILLVRTDRLGDVILTLPMLPLLRKCFPEARIDMLLTTYTSELVSGNPYLNEILLYDNAGGLVPFGAMLQTIQSKSYDIAIIVHPTPRLAWLAFRAGIPMRIGTGYRYYSVLFNRRVFEHRKDAKRHELEYNLNLLNELDCPAGGEPEFSITIPDEVEARVDAMLDGIDRQKELVVIHPGSGGSAREWPAEYFGRLAAKLQDGRGSQVIVTGARGEERKVAEVLIVAKGKAMPLVGQLTLKELAAVIKRASLFVSNSTGPMHIAAALGTPVVSMFPQATAMSAARWGPYTAMKRVLVPDRPVDCRDCVKRNDLPCACMMSISVDDVCEAAGSLLAQRKAGKVASNG